MPVELKSLFINVVHSDSRFMFRYWRIAMACLAAGALELVALAGAGREIDGDIVSVKTVIVESLVLASPVQATSAVLGLDANGESPLIRFSSGQSAHVAFGIFPNHRPGIVLQPDDAMSQTRLLLSVLTTGPSIRISNRNRGVALELGMLDGVASATLSDADGDRMTVSGPGPSGGLVGLHFNNSAGSRVAHFTSTDNLANLALFDKEQHVRTLLGMVLGKNPSLFVYDRRIHPIINMSIEENGLPVIRVNDFARGESKTLRQE